MKLTYNHKIRRASLEDCNGLARVQVDSYRNAYANFFPKAYLDQFTYEEQEQDWRNWLEANTGDVLLVAEGDDQQIIGYVLARTRKDIFPGYDSEIIALHVGQSLQRHGVGKDLLGGVTNTLIDRGCQSLMLWTLKDNTVRKWYESIGGKVIGEKQNQVDGCTIIEVAYGWEDISFLLQALEK